MEIIYVCVILVIVFAVFFIFRYKIHPPIIKIFGQRGEAFVSLYNGIERSGLYGIYKFTRNRKGKWKYEIEDKKYKVKQCAVSALVFPIVSLISSGFSDVLLILKISFLLAVIEAVVLLGVPYLLVLEPYIVLMRYFRKNGTKRTKKMESVTQKEYRFEKTEKIIKIFLKAILFTWWLCGLCILLVPSFWIGFALYALTAAQIFYIPIFFAGAIVLGIIYAWICLGKFIIGDRSCKVPLRAAGKTEKYNPEKLLGRLKNNRSNVILLKNKQGQVRIYGNGEKHVLEVRIGKKEDLSVYHMIYTEDTDSIVPVTDITPTVIENKWREKFPVKNNRLVDEKTIDEFLTKLYGLKDLRMAMEGFSFEDSTDETNRLIEENAYLVPEIPVDWPVGRITSNMGQEWLQRKEDRVQRAMKILSGK